MLFSQMISAWLEPQLPEFLERLRLLVNIDCGTYSKPGVDEVGLRFCHMLRETGCEIKTFPLSEFGDCIQVIWRGRGRLRLLLSGHLDTVYSDGTAAERPLRQEGARLLGPGVIDMKSGLLCGLYAVKALLANGFDDFAELNFFLNTDEEVDSPGSQQLYRPIAYQVDAALVLEGARSNGDIVSARKGCANYTISVHGRQAHAGVEIEKGANAVVELARCIIDLTSLNNPASGTTLNVGVIKGGTRSNVVPDYASAEIDARFITLSAGEMLDQAVHRTIDHVNIPGTHIQLAGGIQKGPMEKSAGTVLLVNLAHQVADDLGITFNDVLTGGTSDGNFIAGYGVPTLDGLGPIGGLDHSPYEYLELDSILPRTTLLAGLIARIAASYDLLPARNR
jgi:glutamate carboxypeptidase